MKDLEILLKNIKNKELLPLYFLHGEEPFFIDQVTDALEQILPEEERDFGLTVVYGKDTNIAEIVAQAQQFPMFGDTNMIIVKEAQDLKFSDEEKKILENFAQNPVPTSVLAFAHKHKKLAGNTRTAKVLKSAGFLFESPAVKDYQVPQWISEEAARLQIKMAPNISLMLAEYLGSDLSRISNELSKVKMLMKDGEILDAKMVEKHIGISKEFNVFELQKALGQRDSARAMKIAHYIAKNPKSSPFPMMLGNLYNFFSNIIIYQTMKGVDSKTVAAEMGVNPYFVKDFAQAANFYPFKLATRVISILREYDLKSKGLGVQQTPHEELLVEMVYKILNVDKVKVAV
ncbi:DNA polymerase III, delta subunit [Cruoricaptor ignavus]|uniref:DNA polymerase III subunit delta n=1 Tax=Cruoricaptor ignavus TaxID=1118202 RepID=A0A1M6GGS1_9FLAO|nr:DNA polymerase III subunit delta [Cruoricaptor ignavus]SHJ09098.1 DNA polymerase III, delta subunit [Cruoricaptor ignavus]